MKKIQLLLVLLLSILSHSQSWQWGKRGGALESMSLSFFEKQEGTYSLKTDSNKNIYGLSRVGSVNLNIDGVAKTNFDNPSWYPSDYALFSFGCDGSYRWSKIIGGEGNEFINPIQVDGQNNVYVSGYFQGCNTNSSYPRRIENDIIIPSNPQDCRNLFFAKYNDAGVLQWIKRPQRVGVDETLNNGYTSSIALQTDASGNSYWLVSIPPDTYENGAFVNTMPGSNYFMLKYDAAGNYTGNIPLNIQATGSIGFLKFYRNPYNGFFYFASSKVQSSDSIIVGGEAVTHSTFIACFDNLGNYLWKREDTAVNAGYINIYNLDFDSDNNIYIGGKIAGINGESFLGLAPVNLITGFVMKTNPTATQTFWSSYNNKGTENYGGIVLNGNELGYTSYCFGTDFTWGTQTLNASAPNQGQEVLLARFNKDTGACIGLTKIPGSNGFDDVGTAITADASGDYILGGAIGGSMFFANGQQIDNAGSQSDFFIAKYATEACSPLAVNENSILAPTLYPNPTKGLVQFDNSRGVYKEASVYNYLGQEIIRPFACSQNENAVIDVSSLANGVYLVKLSGDNGTFTVRVVKE